MTTAMKKQLSIAAFYGFRSGNGGISHVMLNLMNALAAKNIQVDLLLNETQIPELVNLHRNIRVVKLGRASGLMRIPLLVRYLKKTRPVVLLASREPANRVAIVSRYLSNVNTRIVVRVGMAISIALNRRSPIKRWLRQSAIKFCYRRNDAIIANARGVAEDISLITQIPLKDINIINNPTVSPDIFEKAGLPLKHPWFSPDGPPVILGVGRLARQKDFPTLIQAFSKVRSQRDCRLVILGEGKEQKALITLAETLGVRNDIDFPGYTANPFAYMGRSALFVLSSAWEGSPNVLIQALALGVPVVSTDCHSGPREILSVGKYGPLVPVGDAETLADAMIKTLETPPEKALMQEAAAPFGVDDNVQKYMAVMGLQYH